MINAMCLLAHEYNNTALGIDCMFGQAEILGIRIHV